VNQPFKRKDVGVGGGGGERGSLYNICFVDCVLRWEVEGTIEVHAVNDGDCSAHASE
jgi:hypothetical protein